MDTINPSRTLTGETWKVLVVSEPHAHTATETKWAKLTKPFYTHKHKSPTCLETLLTKTISFLVKFQNNPLYFGYSADFLNYNFEPRYSFCFILAPHMLYRGIIVSNKITDNLGFQKIGGLLYGLYISFSVNYRST